MTPFKGTAPGAASSPVPWRLPSLWRLVIVGTLVIGGVGGAVYARHRNTDPSHRADVLTAQGNLRAAQVELRAAIRAAPRDPDLRFRLAELQMKLADPISAEREFKAARALGADRWLVIPRLADALLAQGLNEETLKQVPPTGPTPEAAAKNLYMRAIAQFGLQDNDAAAATLAAAQKVAPHSVEVLLIAARLAAAHEDYAEAEAKVDAVLERAPADIDALLMKQQIVTAREDHPAALAFASRAVKAAPWSAMARIRDATELIFAGQDDVAQVDVDAVLDVQPRFIEAVYLKGILLARRGRYQEAAVQLEKLDQVLGRFPQALYYRALVAANLGQTETAVAFARRYNVLVPGDFDGVRLVGRLDIAAGAPEHAIPLLDQAVADGLNDAEVFDLLGSAEGNLGNTLKAVQAFKRALALVPNDMVVLTHLGLAQIQAGATSEASGTLARTAEVATAPPSAGEALVSAALAEGDIPRAEAGLARLRARAGDSQAVGILSGMIEIRRKNLDAARIAFADTMRRFPASQSAKLDYARVLVMQGRRLDGMVLMAEVLAKQPGNIPALNSYVPLLVQSHQMDRVIEILGSAHAVNPRQAGFTATLADALVLSGEPARAVRVLQDVQEAGPLPPLLLAALARAQAANGMAEEAKASFRDLLRLQPDDVADRTALIDLLLRNGENDVARTELQDALARVPGSFRFMSTLVELEAQTKGLDAGLKLAATLRAEPSHLPFASLLKGDALMRARRYNAASRAFLDEYAADPEVPPLLRAAAATVAAGQDGDAARLLQDWLKHHPNTPAVLQVLAKLDLRANRLDQAQAHLEALLAMVPGDAAALNNLAWTYQLRGDKRARETAQQAFLQDGGFDSADTLGWILAQDGEAAAALPLLEQAGTQAPRDAGIRYHLAATLNAAGRAAEATPMLHALLSGKQAFPDRPAAEKLLAELEPVK